MLTFPFKNLIFQGGGIRTFAYHGVIRGLEKRGVLDQIERVGGTSAGAMLSAILSFRLGVEESIAIYNTLDYAKIPGLKTHMRMPSRLIGAVGSKEMAANVDGLNRLLREYGRDVAKAAVDDVVAREVDGPGTNERCMSTPSARPSGIS